MAVDDSGEWWRVEGQLLLPPRCHSYIVVTATVTCAATATVAPCTVALASCGARSEAPLVYFHTSMSYVTFVTTPI
jgi:hypothetical protein